MRFQFGEFQLDDRRLTLAGPAGPVHVEPQVFGLLHHLIAHRDRVVSKEELLDAVWGNRFVSESALTSRVKAARRAVGDDGRAQRVIETAHGRGYRFVAPVRVDDGGARRVVPRLRSAPIGRDGDVLRVIERVRAVPLVTITGSAGMGKTTLALAVADRLEAEFAEWAVFVDLAPVPAHADVTRAVAEAAGVEGAASEHGDRLAAVLANRPLLLLLDNCEHVLERTAELVAWLLDRGGAAHVLATSREPLGLVGEHVWPLGPLSDDAPVLFVERARAAEPRVRWDPADPAVIRLCRRLDGVPLALELAAGQLRRFDLDELNRRLEDRLSLLSRHAPGDAPRHATMETAIDWSYRLLDDAEQTLLRHLGVFPSSFDLRAVEASAPPLPGADPVLAFGGLVDKSLVVRLPGQGRYRLLETIRVYARDRLGRSGEEEGAFQRHGRFVRDRIASAPRLDRWMSARLGAEFRTQVEDARQAFHRSLQAGDAADAVEIAIGGSFLWRNAIGSVEGDGWVGSLSRLVLSPRDALWVELLRADVGQGRGDHRQMFAAGAAAEARSGRADDPIGMCLAAHYAALAHLTDASLARGRLARVLGFAEEAADARLVTMIEVYVAVADLVGGRYDDARAAVTRLDGVASAEGYDRYLLNWAGWMLGLAERDAAAARHWITGQHELLDRTGIVESWLSSFSTALCDIIDGGDARTALAHTLAVAEREGYEAGADCVLALAYAEILAGRPEVAAELVGTAMHARFYATAHYILYRTVLDQALRPQLEPGRLEAAMARGRARTPAECLARYGITRGPPAGQAVGASHPAGDPVAGGRPAGGVL